MANAGTVWLVLQLVGGQPTHTPYISQGDCEVARCMAMYGEICTAGHKLTQKPTIQSAQCSADVKHPRLVNGDLDWPLPVVQKASYEIIAKPPVKKPVAKKPVKKKAPAKKRR